MTAPLANLQRAVATLVHAAVLAGAALLVAIPAIAAADRAELSATQEDGFARLVLAFPDRLDLPAHRVRHDNGIVAIEFEEEIAAMLPEIAVALPGHVSAAKVDPDGRGIRLGLRQRFILHQMTAGERLFIDLLPVDWQGLPPALPPEIVAELAERAKRAAAQAEQQRKAEQARVLNPVPTLRVGRNPTFIRLQFDWSIDTEAEFRLNGGSGQIVFDWPVPIDLYELKAALPKELRSVSNIVGPWGSRFSFRVAEGVAPRFYATSKRQFVMDIDIPAEEGIAAGLAADAAKQQAAAIAAAVASEQEGTPVAAGATEQPAPRPPGLPDEVTPIVSSAGPTVRITFPFEHDTAAAVFRRGDVVWMLFETGADIHPPAQSDPLAAVATSFQVLPAGAVKLVRLDLATERLATLGSEGRSWVLSLGDVLLTPTQPVEFSRRRDEAGEFRMSAALQQPSRVHMFRDPVAGDVLQVVTAYPPARGVARTQEFVDFAALRSIHGLVLKPHSDSLAVSIDGPDAVIAAEGGLVLSALETVRRLDAGNAPEFRGSFVELAAAREDNPVLFAARREQLMAKAAATEGRLRDVARFELAQFYVANQFAPEAIGVLGVLEKELSTPDLRKRIRLLRGIASVQAWRWRDALAILGTETYGHEVDALMWRSIAKAQGGDFEGARADAISAESVIGSYPGWVQVEFLLAGARSAFESGDAETAARYLRRVEFAKLDPEEATHYQLLQGRLAELEGRPDEALDNWGQVIAADLRPTRAEAVYRTLRLLARQGRVDVSRATETLSAEVLLWRGDWLEAEMQTLLAELYFRDRDYRNGFETVKQAVAYHPENKATNQLLAQAEAVFGELFLDGRADELDDVEALTLYYDFRELTPPGQRGDEMIRNLARRLVEVDLLTQAGDLLEYQIDNRLAGLAQARIAADLAVIRIADRDPHGALRALSRTRLAELPPTLARQRRILEARALIDAGREELALDLLSRVEGRDADLLRVEGLWKAKNYGMAAELLEVVYGPGRNSEPLSQTERMNVIKAGVGFVMAGDALGLTRLRSKFADQLALSPEWPMFDFVTAAVAPTGVEFASVARQIAGLDSLNAFLESYRATYARSSALAPATAVPRENA